MQSSEIGEKKLFNCGFSSFGNLGNVDLHDTTWIKDRK